MKCRLNKESSEIMGDLQHFRLLPKNRWQDHVLPSRPSWKGWLFFCPWHFQRVFRRWMLSGGLLRDKQWQICFKCSRCYHSHKVSILHLPVPQWDLFPRGTAVLRPCSAARLRDGIALTLNLEQLLADEQAGLEQFNLNKSCFVCMNQQPGECRGEVSVKNA